MQASDSGDQLDNQSSQDRVVPDYNLSNINIELRVEEHPGYLSAESSDLQEIKFASGNEWCSKSSKGNIDVDNLETHLRKNIVSNTDTGDAQYFQLPAINADYYDIPNHVTVAEGNGHNHVKMVGEEDVMSKNDKVCNLKLDTRCYEITSIDKDKNSSTALENEIITAKNEQVGYVNISNNGCHGIAAIIEGNGNIPVIPVDNEDNVMDKNDELCNKNSPSAGCYAVTQGDSNNLSSTAKNDLQESVGYCGIGTIGKDENVTGLEMGGSATVKAEYYGEQSVIIHLDDNLSIDEQDLFHASNGNYLNEQSQLHSSNRNYFEVPTKDEVVGCVLSGIEGSIKTEDVYEDDEMGCDVISITADTVEGDQFDESIECSYAEDEQMGLKGEVFIISTVDELQDVVREYSERTSSHFVGSSKSKNFGSPSSECILEGHQISWCDIQSKARNNDSIIKFDGVPYMIVGNNILHCQFGTNKSAADRERRKLKRAERGIDVTHHNLKYPTKKCGCPAKINIKQIIRFPEFKIEKDTGWKRRDCAARLRQKLRECRDAVKMEMKFVGRFPDISEHKYHESLQELVYTKELVLQDLVVKAQNLWFEGKSNSEIFELIRFYVINEMFWNREPPDLKMKKYYPTKKDIRNYVTRVYHMCLLRDSEKESIKQIISNILSKEQTTNISFDLSERNLNEANEIDSSEEDNPDSHEDVKSKRILDKKVETFLFCHQTPMQQRLVRRYNNVLYIAEINPLKPVKRVLTYFMYALLVQTNIDYQVIGSILLSKHRKEGLVEALTIFREWNSFLNPRYVIVDCSEQIYTAITTLFPDTQYFLNPLSCEKKWLEFINTPSNNLQEHANELISHLKCMQYSLTEESLSIAAVEFEGSQVWQNSEKFRTWFQTEWLPIAKYWVMGYRPEDLLVLQHLKFSINDCVNVYQDSLYNSAKFGGFIDLLKWITNSAPNIEYKKHMARCSEAFWYYSKFSKYNPVLDHMQGIPISLKPYLIDIYHLAQMHDFVIKRDQIGVFIVQYNLLDDNKTVRNDAFVNGVYPNFNCSFNILPHDQNQQGSGIIISVRDRKKHIENVAELSGMQDVSVEKNGFSPNDKLNGGGNAIRETEFGLLEYSKKMDTSEYTVSFGDLHSHPFCTCSHWMLYRLPCVHMFAVFIKVPGWSYDMLSPLYRSNSVLHIDYSCVLNRSCPRGINAACQKWKLSASVGTQTVNSDLEIFEHVTNFSSSQHVLAQAKDFSLNLDKNAYLFRDKSLYGRIRCQLDKLIGKLYTVSSKPNLLHFGVGEENSSNIPSLDNRRPLKISTLNLHQIVKNTEIHTPIKMTGNFHNLPRVVFSGSKSTAGPVENVSDKRACTLKQSMLPDIPSSTRNLESPKSLSYSSQLSDRKEQEYIFSNLSVTYERANLSSTILSSNASNPVNMSNTAKIIKVGEVNSEKITPLEGKIRKAFSLSSPNSPSQNKNRKYKHTENIWNKPTSITKHGSSANNMSVPNKRGKYILRNRPSKELSLDKSGNSFVGRNNNEISGREGFNTINNEDENSRENMYF